MINRQRRLFLKGSLRLGAAVYSITAADRVLALWSEELFESQEAEQLLNKLSEGVLLQSTSNIELKVPALVENAAILPVSVRTDLQAVESISLLVTSNSNPLVGTFQFGEGVLPALSTRVRLESPGEVLAMVKTSDGYYIERAHVDIKAFDCSPAK